MMIVTVLSLVAGVLSLLLAAVVLIKGRTRRHLRFTYASFAGSIGVWALLLGVFLVSDHIAVATWAVHGYYLVGIIIPYSFLLFSFAYLRNQLTTLVKLLLFIPVALVIILVVIPHGMIMSISVQDRLVFLEMPSYSMYTAVFIIYALTGLVVLLRGARRVTKNLIHRRVVAVSLLVGFLGGGFFDIILPLFGNYTLIAYGPLFAFITSAGIFYVIARHGVFDIAQTVVRSIAYILSLMTIAGLYLMVAYWVFDRILGQRSDATQTVLSVSLTTALVLAFQPIKSFFDRLTNKVFYRYTYDAEQVFAKLNHLLATVTDLSGLLRGISSLISTSLKIDQVFIIVHTSEETFIQAGTRGYRKLPLTDIQLLDTSTASTQGAHLRDDTETISQELRRMLVSHGVKVVVPLIETGKTTGYLCLGDHQKNDYALRDIRMAEAISEALVVAVQNALSIREVQHLNQHLQQRIDEATRELRLSNTRLRRLDEAKDEFISMASHQLRTPLTSIKGYIDMILEGDAGKITAQQRAFLTEAFASSERMVHLINDFLSVSRLQTGKFILEKRPVDLSAIVSQELESLAISAEQRQLSFSYHPAKNIPLLELDEAKIRQVIMNLVDNALYYSKPDSTIRVKLKVVEKTSVEFTVKDTGIGVPKSEQPELFTKFFRASNARYQRPDGTGIGLYLAKRVVMEHGGHIIFSSVEGQGSTFGFRLPIAALRPETPPEN